MKGPANTNVIKVFHNVALRDKNTVPESGEKLKSRIRACGGVLQGSREDKMMCFEECLESLFV